MFQILSTLAFAVAYITRVLLYEDRVSHYGPWPSKNSKVVRMQRPAGEEILYTQEHPVTAFDRIRQATTGAYDVDKKTNTWYVREDRMEMWTCPKCLTFWVAGAVVIPYCLLTGKWKDIPVTWMAVCGLGYMAYNLSDVEIVVNNDIYMDDGAIIAEDGDEDEAL
jgi:hypothetical protein